MALSIEKEPPSHISFVDLQRLYWGEFPYRVSIQLSPLSIRRCKNASGRRSAVDRLLRRVNTETVPYAEYRKKDYGYNFFFADLEDAENFIDANVKMIDEVVRPLSEHHVDLLKGANVIVRKNLWFNQYSYRIIFKGMSRYGSESVAVADAFYEEAFGEETGDTAEERDARAYYNYANRRILFLRDERDVVLTRLSIEGDHIQSVERIVLADRNGD